MPYDGNIISKLVVDTVLFLFAFKQIAVSSEASFLSREAAKE